MYTTCNTEEFHHRTRTIIAEKNHRKTTAISCCIPFFFASLVCKYNLYGNATDDRMDTFECLCIKTTPLCCKN